MLPLSLLLAVVAPARAAEAPFAYVGAAELRAGTSEAPQAPASGPGWHLAPFPYSTGLPLRAPVSIRAGYYGESPDAPFRGNILYFEGFADSMLNHDPLFAKLSAAGYRVIAFDYMGQGGSGGSMNDTRLVDPVVPGLQVRALAERVYERFRRADGPARKVVLGWSTGGLAAYDVAARGGADAAVLIAPGLCVRSVVKVSVETLTHAKPAPAADPHVDPVKPSSPLLAPGFAANMLLAPRIIRGEAMPPGVKGLVLLAGEDHYVDAACIGRALDERAPSFERHLYPGAEHELDNEVPEVADDVAARIVDFLSRL